MGGLCGGSIRARLAFDLGCSRLISLPPLPLTLGSIRVYGYPRPSILAPIGHLTGTRVGEPGIVGVMGLRIQPLGPAGSAVELAIGTSGLVALAWSQGIPPPIAAIASTALLFSGAWGLWVAYRDLDSGAKAKPLHRAIAALALLLGLGLLPSILSPDSWTQWWFGLLSLTCATTLITLGIWAISASLRRGRPAETPPSP